MEVEKKVERITAVPKVRIVQKDYRFRNLLLKKKKQWRNKDGKVAEEKATEDKVDDDYMENKSYVEEVKNALMYGDIGHGVLLDKKV
ncbi:hypothetical protein [Clostridium sp. C8-1-8]|jgi:hypothetical protein|uniref:hypothetical protein n=1 Tax=Clostridium sp. C8-1-8 TaxID=2698831 RepID=UPI00136ADAF9|nr:hypothetical protein [Clostridium sp. C8-1-8]